MHPSADAAVLALANRQDGVVNHAQCRRLGLTDRQIAVRIARGWWRRMHRQVYAIGGGALVPRARYLAGVFGGGPGAVLSHRSGAGLWRVQPHHAGPVHVTGGISRAPRSTLVVHRTRRFEQGVRTVRHGVPVTTLARTLIDLAEIGSPEEVETAVRAAERLHDFDRRLLVPIPGRRGARLLAPPSHFIRGHLEPLLTPLLVRHGLALPVFNEQWEGLELDAVWWSAGLVLEVDDWETHRHRDAFIRDRRRSRRIQAAGYRAIQATYEDLTRDAATFAAELRALGVPLV